MAIRVARPTLALASILFLSLGQFALAQNTGNAPGVGPGNTSGPAVGTDVQPSTAIQKDQTGRSSAGGGDASNAAGAPGVEGKPGSESGPLPQDRSSQPPK
jgi:hypothetical protein